MPLPILSLAVAAQAVLLSGAVGPDARVQRETWVMGTRLRVIAEGAVADDALAATEAVIREVERWDGLLSTWTPDTHVSRLNAAPVDTPVSLPAEVHALLLEARRWVGATEGAFDPAVGALVSAWDLRGDGRVPDAEMLRRAVAAVGLEAWSVDEHRPRARRRSALTWIDTGAFGKGAALRSAAKLARAAGSSDLRVSADLGGQLWAAAPHDRPWRVPVAHPVRRGEPVLELLLHDVSVATSGTSERRVDVGGQRFGHILDPRDGRPAPAWGTVTVVHEDALAADVLATALYVMGPDDGMRWLERHPDVAALFLDVRHGDVRFQWTAAMEPWLADRPIHFPEGKDP